MGKREFVRAVRDNEMEWRMGDSRPQGYRAGNLGILDIKVRAETVAWGHGQEDTFSSKLHHTYCSPKHMPPSSSKGLAVFWDGVNSGKMRVVRHYIEKGGASVNIRDEGGRTPLHYAGISGLMVGI